MPWLNIGMGLRGSLICLSIGSFALKIFGYIGGVIFSNNCSRIAQEWFVCKNISQSKDFDKHKYLLTGIGVLSFSMFPNQSPIFHFLHPIGSGSLSATFLRMEVSPCKWISMKKFVVKISEPWSKNKIFQDPFYWIFPRLLTVPRAVN